MSQINATVPHYALPNIASRLPEFANSDAEAIRAAFVSNSYRTIAQVRLRKDGSPDAEGGGGVVQSSFLATINAPAFKAGSGEKGLFLEFKYECSPYDITSQLVLEQRKTHDEVTQKVSTKPFVVQGINSSMYGALRESDPAGAGPIDPFDAVRDEEFCHKWLEEHRARPFLPAGREKPLLKPTRAMLTDIMTHLYKVLCEDWNEAHPTVLATSEDLIVVYFSKEGIKNEVGIQAYMGVFARRNDVVLNYDLRRVNEGWSVSTNDGHIMFTFRPPWVRQRSFLSASNISAVKNVN